MKKRLISIFFTIVIAITTICTFTACGTSTNNGINYPDFANTPNDKNSWEYIDEEFEIDWYVGISGFTDFTWGTNAISNYIKQKLGVKVNFITTTENYDNYLASLISSGDVPDVVTISYASSAAKQMITQGYTYPIDGLAERWAPTLYNNLNNNYKDIINYFTANQDHLYFIPSHSWAESDMNETAQRMVMSNGGIFVREDLLDWFTKKYPEVDVMTSDGFYQMLSTVQSTFGFTAGLGGNVDGISKVQYLRGLQLAKVTDASSSAMEYLSEMFAAPYEDKEGNYIDKRTTDQYIETLDFLNRAYNDKIISEANMTETFDQSATAIASGKVFCFVGKPQDYTNNFQTARNAYGYNYVPLIVTNKAGDDPILQSEMKYAYTYNMITTSAKRPDLIIKLFDYMWSDEGQLMTVFGKEGEAWNWPNGDKSGKIVMTEDFASHKANWNDTWKGYGANQFWFLARTGFYTRVRPDNSWTINELYKSNFRLPLQPISYNYALSFVDCYSLGDSQMAMISNNVETYWQNNVVSILISPRQSFRSTYDAVINSMNAYNWQDLINYYNVSFKKVKDKMGIEYAWPLNNPTFVSKIKDASGNYIIDKCGDNSNKAPFTAIEEIYKNK